MKKKIKILKKYMKKQNQDPLKSRIMHLKDIRNLQEAHIDYFGECNGLINVTNNVFKNQHNIYPTIVIPPILQIKSIKIPRSLIKH